jgi:hypothetical protein
MPSSLTPKFPATSGIRWFNLAVFTLTTIIAIYGLFTVRLRRDTALFAMAYYIFSMLGERNARSINSRGQFHASPSQASQQVNPMMIKL